MAESGALDLSIRIMGKVDPSLATAIKQTKGMTNDLMQTMQGTNSLSGTVATALGVVGKTGLGIMGMLSATSALMLKKTTAMAQEYQSQAADAVKYIDGIMDEDGNINIEKRAAMEDEILKVTTQVPLDRNEIAQIAASLGQSNKSYEEIFYDRERTDEKTGEKVIEKSYLYDTARLAAAWDIEAEDAADYMAKWEVAFGKTHEQIIDLADSINYLGGHMATTAAEIAGVVNVSGGVGQTAGVDLNTTSAMAATMLAMGVDEGKAGTSLNRVFTNITLGNSASKEQYATWKALGFDPVQVAKDMQSTGPNGEDGAASTLYKVFDAISKQDEYKQTATIKTLFGQWAIEGVSKIVGNLPAFQNALLMAGDTSAYSGSMEKELLVRLDTGKAVDQMASNATDRLLINVGNQFLPAKKEIASIWIDIANGITESLPDLSSVVNGVLPLLRTGVMGIGDAAKAALPWIQKGIDYATEHGPEVAGAIAAIIAAFGAMSVAPAAYNAGGALMNTIGNIVIGGKPSGSPGGTFGGITVRNLLGMVTPTNLFQKTVSEAVFAKSNAGMFAENAKYGAQMAGIGVQQPTTRLGRIKQTLDGAGVGIWATVRNFKGLQKGTKKANTNFVNDVLTATTNGGLPELLKNTSAGKYATSVRQSISALGNTAIGGGLVKAGGVAKQILSGIAGPQGINFPGIFTGLKSFGGATLSVMGGLGKSALGNIGKAGVGILAKTGIVTPSRGRAIWRMANSTVGLNGQDALTQMGYIFSQTKGSTILANAKNKLVGGATKLAGGAIGTVKNVGQFAGAGLNVLGSTVGPVASKLGGGFLSMLGTFGPVITSLGTMVAVVSLLGDHFEDIRDIVKTVFGDGGLIVFDKFTGKIAGIGDKAKQVFGQLSTPEGLQSIKQQLSSFSIGDLNLGDMFGAAIPAIQTAMPLIQSFSGVFGQIVDLGVNHIKPVLTEIFGFVVNQGIPAVMPLLATLVSLIGTTLVNAIKVTVDVVGKLLPVVEPVILGIIGFLKQAAVVGVKVVNCIIGALNKIQLKIPETLFGIPIPVVGGKSFGFNLATVALPQFANGGMTKGPSIAGEAGPEAVISFKRGVREKNIGTWLTAGKMLGVGLGDLLGLPGKKPTMYEDGGFTDENSNLIDFREAQRQRYSNQSVQNFDSAIRLISTSFIHDSDESTKTDRITRIVNYAVDKLGFLPAMSAAALPQFASGGMTKGPSIAGEAGPEAVISFKRGVREKNINTWLTAGKILGVGLGDLLGLPGKKPAMYEDGGVTGESDSSIDFRKAQRQRYYNQLVQSFDTMIEPVAAGLVLGSDAGVAFSRITEIANYAVDGLESLAALPAPEVTENQSKLSQTVNNGIGKIIFGAQSIIGNEKAQKAIQFIRDADVEKARLESQANIDNYDLSNVNFFPTASDGKLTRQNLAMLENLQDHQQEVEVKDIGDGGDESDESTNGGRGNVGGTNYRRSYTSSEGNTYVYAPNFTIYGSMDAEDLRSVLDEGYEKFCEYVERYEREKRRTRYGT